MVLHRPRSCSWALGSLMLAGCTGADVEMDPTATTTATTSGFTATAVTEATTDGATEATESDGTTTASSTATTTATTTPGSESDTEASTTTGGPCGQGDVICDGDVAKICDGMGGFEGEETCPAACAPGLGCVACVPGSHQCVGELSQVCQDDGSGYVDVESCDPLQGLSCDGGTGECAGACANLGSASYIGCDYYPVVTPQLDNFIDDNPYAVAVANTAASPAMITITKGDVEVMAAAVPAGSVELFELPWVDELVLGNGPSTIAAAGAYRLRSDQPVTVYQYNPLNADITNDASLMLPVNTWTGNYVVVAWPFLTSLGNAGFYSVTASQEGTMVTVTPPGGGTPTQAGAGISATGSGTVMLDPGDVLQVFVADGGDPTGTLIHASKPVQVMAGHECTQVPIGTNACDHLEESLFPVETLAKEYVVVPPVQVPNDMLEKAVIVRVVASEDDTHLTFEPDQAVAKTLAKAGDFVEIPASVAKFVVSSDKKILVAEYMVGQGGGFGESDPAMLLVVPSAQYRDDYLVYADTGWSANYVDIVAPMGASVTVDGASVGAFAPVGQSGFGLAHVKLSNAGDGTHSISADDKVGISVYGVLNFGSYWYPGGLDLALIPQ